MRNFFICNHFDGIFIVLLKDFTGKWMDFIYLLLWMKNELLQNMGNFFYFLILKVFFSMILFEKLLFSFFEKADVQLFLTFQVQTKIIYIINFSTNHHKFLFCPCDMLNIKQHLIRHVSPIKVLTIQTYIQLHCSWNYFLAPWTLWLHSQMCNAWIAILTWKIHTKSMPNFLCLFHT